MKKIIIIAFAVLTTGFVSSCTKDNSVKPSVQTVKAGENSGTGSADGTPRGVRKSLWAEFDSPDRAIGEQRQTVTRPGRLYGC